MKGGSAGRVIAGTARGRPLVAPGAGTRPLGDRVKQALFAILEPDLRGRAFLDLFAGSGAAGIEALSRGAAGAVFVDRDRGAVDVLERNLAATRLGGPAATVVRSDVGTWLSSGAAAHGPFGIAIVDPPYDRPDELVGALRGIADAGPGGILAADGVVVAKHASRGSPPAEVGLLRSARDRRFGDTTLTFYRWAGAATGEDDPGE